MLATMIEGYKKKRTLSFWKWYIAKLLARAFITRDTFNQHSPKVCIFSFLSIAIDLTPR